MPRDRFMSQRGRRPVFIFFNLSCFVHFALVLHFAFQFQNVCVKSDCLVFVFVFNIMKLLLRQKKVRCRGSRKFCVCNDCVIDSYNEGISTQFTHNFPHSPHICFPTLCVSKQRKIKPSPRPSLGQGRLISVASRHPSFQSTFCPTFKAPSGQQPING